MALPSLMLVSAGRQLQLGTDDGAPSPCADYARLSQRHGTELLDWGAIGAVGGGRSVRRSIRHVVKALPLARGARVVFSDGEHIGIPMALGLGALGLRTPHVVIGHHLATPAKLHLLRSVRPQRWMDRILVHSERQIEVLEGVAGMRNRLRVVRYGIDTEFWAAEGTSEEADLVVSAGREHRDYATLVAAAPADTRVVIADGSNYSPAARRREPTTWPAAVERHTLSAAALRTLYARAAVVVVPVAETEFPAGITTLLEAMSMGKAIVVTRTEGLRDIVSDEFAAVVPPGDIAAMRTAITALLEDPARRRTLGRAARQAACERFDLDGYADELARHLQDVGSLATRRPAV